MASIMYK